MTHVLEIGLLLAGVLGLALDARLGFACLLVTGLLLLNR